jgi:hypothetical protein
MDYSKVTEPDLYRCLRRQNDSTTAYIKQLVGNWQDKWARRKQLRRDAIAKAGEFWFRHKNVYYDDSGINEEQYETVKLCPHCRGYLVLTTSAVGRTLRPQTAFAAVIWRDSCPHCRQQARDAVLAAKREGQYQHYIVQDLQEDVVEVI